MMKFEGSPRSELKIYTPRQNHVYTTAYTYNKFLIFEKKTYHFIFRFGSELWLKANFNLNSC